MKSTNFKNETQYTLPITRWYGERKKSAIRVIIPHTRYKETQVNMPLHTAYVKILSSKEALVWGSWINLTIRKNKVV